MGTWQRCTRFLFWTVGLQWLELFELYHRGAYRSNEVKRLFWQISVIFITVSFRKLEELTGFVFLGICHEPLLLVVQLLLLYIV